MLDPQDGRSAPDAMDQQGDDGSPEAAVDPATELLPSERRFVTAALIATALVGIAVAVWLFA